MSISDRNQQKYIEKLMALPRDLVEEALEELAFSDTALSDHFRRLLKLDASELDSDLIEATLPAATGDPDEVCTVEEVLDLFLKIKDHAFSETSKDEDAIALTIQSSRSEDIISGEMPAPSAAGDELIGVVLGNKYRIVRLLGRGAFGSVYEGVDEMLGASVAIKVLNAKLSGHDSAIGQFLGEARLLTTLDHANIVRWITFDRTPEGLHYFVMEFLRGQELSDVLTEEGPLPPDDVIKILQQILSALDAAHNLPDGRSLLHLDLKPRNVFAVHGEDRQIKVIDFGISQHVGAAARDEPEPEPESVPDEDVEFADFGATMSTMSSQHDTAGGYTAKGVQRALGGTPLYASPEHCRHLRGEEDIVELDGRSDLYSLGIMGWEMLAGRMPWKPTTLSECFENALESPLPALPPVADKIPPNLERFLNKCTAKNRDERFADVRAAKEALDEIANPKGPVLAVAASLMLVMAVMIWLLWPSQVAQRIELSEQEIYFGPDPDHSSAELRVGNLLAESRAGEIRFVNDTTPQRAQLLADWGFELLDGDGIPRVQITPPADSALVDEAVVYLEIGDPPQFSSQPLHVVYLPGGSCSLAASEVPGADDRMVDPEGAQIETTLVGGEAEWVANVVCRFGDQKLPASRVEGLETPVYRTAMADFKKLPTAANERSTFTMVVTDKAGNQHADECSVVLATTELTIDPQLLECGTSATVPLLYPETRPLLRIHADREVDIELSARRTDKDESIPVTKVREGSDYRLTISGPEEAYRAKLTVKARDNRVYHANKLRGTKTVVVPFQYEVARPALLVTEATAGRLVSPDQSPETSSRFVTNQDQVSLVLRRENLVEMTVLVECELDGQPFPIEDPLVELHSEAEKTKVVELTEDGQYSFSFATYRRASERAQAPEFAPKAVVIRDTSEPSIAFTRTPRDLVEATDDTVLTTVQVDGRDDASKLLGHLTGPLERDLEMPLPPGAPAQIDLSFEQFELQPGELTDGNYSLELVAVDAAGNEGRAGEEVFVVARQGPSLRLVSPGSNNRWDKEGDQFTLKIQGEDENGVSAVECRLTLTTARDETTDWLAMELVDSADPRGGEWRRECILSGTWSGKRVEVAWRGEDAYGNPRVMQTIEKTLPTFESQLRSRIWNTTPAGDPVSMRVVRGAQGYTYGGRGRGSERAAFARADLLLDDLGLRFMPVQENIGNYYLDETEVTVASYLSFLQAEDGYRSAAHWREAKPDEDRREQLIAVLVTMDARLPVTGLDWYECSAYAAWSGKRLPTPVEWEYAARGGTEYRVFSCVGTDFDREQFAVSVPEAWSVEDGCDRVPRGVAAGIRNLCSNVSEWVSGTDSDSCYSAGASFEDGQYHFSILRPTNPNERSAHTGFRCAVDASVVRKQLETGASLRFSIDVIDQAASTNR